MTTLDLSNMPQAGGYRIEYWGRYGLTLSTTSTTPVMLARVGELWRFEPYQEYTEGLLVRVDRIEWSFEADTATTVARVYTIPVPVDEARAIDAQRPDGVPRIESLPVAP